VSVMRDSDSGQERESMVKSASNPRPESNHAHNLGIPACPRKEKVTK